MTLRRRDLLIGAGGGLAAAALAGCGGGDSGGASSGGTVTLQMVESLTSPNRTTLLKKMLADFEKANPTIKVQLVSPPTDQADPPPPVEDGGQATAAVEAPPSRVWGREDVTRESVEADGPGKPAPWSQLAALAGAVVVVGGLGTAFARGLQSSQPPVVEEE